VGCLLIGKQERRLAVREAVKTKIPSGISFLTSTQDANLKKKRNPLGDLIFFQIH